MAEFLAKTTESYETGFVMGNTQSRWVMEIIRRKRATIPADLKELQLPPGTRIQDEFVPVIVAYTLMEAISTRRLS